MSITVDLTPEEEVRLRQDANAHGLGAEEFLRRLWLAGTLIEKDALGRPRITGTTLRVSMLIGAKEADNFTEEEVVSECFPHLTLAQVQAAVAYYDTHQEEIDAEREDERRFVEEMRTKPSQPPREELRRRMVVGI